MTDPLEIDPSALRRLDRIGGSGFVRKMIDLFLTEAPNRLRAARAGEQVGDLHSVSEAVHALKSSARNFGADRLGMIAEEIEHLTRANSNAGLPALLGDLEQAYATARAWLESERANLDL